MRVSRLRLQVRGHVAYVAHQVRFGVLLIALIAQPHRVCAQDPHATLIGSMSGKDGRPIRFGEIVILGQGQDIKVPVDDSGRFVRHDLPSGPATLRARRFGFVQRDTTVVLKAGATVEWRAVLTSAVALLGTRDSTTPGTAEVEAATAAAGRVDSIAIGRVTTDTSLAFTYTSFGLRLLHAAVKRFSPDSNRILSPLGAGQALAVALLGTRDSTTLAMAQTLGLGQLTAESLAARNHWFNNYLGHRRDLILNVANAVWVDTSASLKAAFERAVRQEYEASVRVMPLASPRIVPVLNRWADSTTAGRIRQVRTKPFERDAKVVLANAVYLKSTWLTPFDSKQTRQRPFTMRSGQQVMAPMMESTGRFAYRRGEHFQVVRLPYKDGLTALYIVLPDSGQSALATLDRIQATEWPFPSPVNETEKVHLLLPKMHVEQQTDLMDPLTALGMGIAFDPGRADFSNLVEPRPNDPPPCPPLSQARNISSLSCTRHGISEIKQNTYFDVNEEGTEAAAVTVVEIVRLRGGVRPIQFVIDRPFLLALRDERTGTLLFLGYIARPQ